MSALTELLGSNYPWAAQRAQDALSIQTAVQANQITVAQATELLQDLIDTDALNKEANDFTTRTKLVNAVTDLITLISNASIIPGVKI